MQDKLNKIIYGILLLLVVLLSVMTISKQSNKKLKYSKRIFYMDTYIYIQIDNQKEDTANKALEEAEKIFKHYHQLSDRYNSYNNINNLYYIKNNTSDEEYIQIDKDLYDLISYGIFWYDKSNGLLDISLGNITDIWKKYIQSGNGVPSNDELNKANIYNIKDIILKDNSIYNNHVNIDLGAISKGYTTEKVGQYFESVGINSYLINAGGNVKVGTKNNANYKIGIQDPDGSKTDVYKVVEGNNISVITSGNYERYYKYNNKIYGHIINPKTLFPSSNIKSITVITNDSALGDAMSTILYLMDIDEAKLYLKDYDVEATWYVNKDKQYYTDGFDKYE